MPGLDGGRWLYVVNFEDNEAQGPCNPNPRDPSNGSVRVFRVDSALDVAGNQPVLLGRWDPSECLVDATEHGYFLDCVVLPSGAGHAVLVTYGPRNEETGCGLVVLEATLDGQTGSVDLAFVDKVEFSATPVDVQVTRLTHDPSRGLLYAGFGCTGIGMFDVSDPLLPALVGSVTDLGEQSALHVALAPDDHVYVTLLSGGIGIIDAASAGTFAQGFIAGTPYATPFQANAVVPAPTLIGFPEGSTVFVADGRGGVHRMQFFDF